MESTLLELGKLFGPGAMMIAALLYYIKVRDDRTSKENVDRETRMVTRMDFERDEFTKCRRETIEKNTENLIRAEESRTHMRESIDNLCEKIDTCFLKEK